MKFSFDWNMPVIKQKGMAQSLILGVKEPQKNKMFLDLARREKIEWRFQGEKYCNSTLDGTMQNCIAPLNL